MLDLNQSHGKRFIYAVWMLMAFQAGYINVGGLFLSGNFVSHVTGTSSQIAIGLAQMDFSILATFTTILLSFIVGAAFAGHHIGRMQLEGRPPRFIFVLTVKAFFFTIILLLSENDILHFLSWPQMVVNWVIIFMLSFCCGVQNATCSLATDGFLKPTHMTGLSTEVGIALTRPTGYSRRSKQYKDERRKLQLRVGILISFIFGGAFASVIFTINGHYGFFFPLITSLSFLFFALTEKQREVKLGRWVFQVAKGAIFAVFLTTVLIGMNSFLQAY